MNNYLVFKYAYFNAVEGINLYLAYPEHYLDHNYYGPIFCLIIAPFAVLPGNIGIYLWQICNALLLFYAIQQLPLSTLKKNVICIICIQELIISLKEFQTNGAVAALIILAWVMVENKKDFWAALFIMLGLFVKLYGILGIVFFLFSKQKQRFILSLFFWGVVLFILPMPSFGPRYIAGSYLDWYHALLSKNAMNTDVNTQYQDVSVMGMIRRIAGHPIPIFPILLSGVVLFLATCYFSFKYQWERQKFLLLASSLLFVVLFSTGSEQATYIIAFAGIAIWFITAPRPIPAYQTVLFIFAIYFGSLFRTDIFPRYIKDNYILPYALKALPCLMVWLSVVVEMVTVKQVRRLAEDGNVVDIA